MKGKPFLVALAAFVIVVFGGVAIAGAGSLTTGSSDVGTFGSEPMALEVPAWESPTTTKAATTTTAPAEKPKPEAKTDDVAEKAAKPDAAPPTVDKDEKKAEDSVEKKTDEPTEEKSEAADLFSLDYPADGARFTSKVVSFGGEAADGVTIHRGKYSAEPTAGQWAMELVLAPGKNIVAFKASNAAGDLEAATVTVYYDAPKEDTDPNHEKTDDHSDGEKKDDGTKDHADTKFSANQKYGSCGETVPYDKFWGTAKPGSTIKATSPYGSNSTVAGEHGHWEMKVTFPDAPQGEKFTVTITSSDGGSQSFTFVNTGSKDH